MGATEDYGVDIFVAGKQAVDLLLDEIVGAVAIGFVVFDQRHPHRAALANGDKVGVELGDFHVVRFALDGARGAEDADVARFRYLTDFFDGRADDAEHATSGVGADREVVLLNAAQGFGRGGVASENHERAAALKEGFYGLKGEGVDHIEAAIAIGCARIVAQIEVVIPGQAGAQIFENGEPAVAGVEHANGAEAGSCGGGGNGADIGHKCWGVKKYNGECVAAPAIIYEVL